MEVPSLGEAQARWEGRQAMPVPMNRVLQPPGEARVPCRSTQKTPACGEPGRPRPRRGTKAGHPNTRLSESAQATGEFCDSGGHSVLTQCGEQRPEFHRKVSLTCVCPD